MREQQDRLDELGMRLIGVAPREAHQAERLMADGIGVDLLLDPSDSIREVLGAHERFSAWRLLHPKGALAYAKSIQQAGRFDPIWSQATRRPGVLVLDASLHVVWSHIGRFIGDYPTANEILAAAAASLGNPRRP